MASTLLDGGFSGYPFAWDWHVPAGNYSTSPVTEAEVGTTPHLEDGMFLPGPGAGVYLLPSNDLISGVSGTVASPPGPVAPPKMSHGTGTAVVMELYDGDLYNRIIVTPGVMDLGDVLTTTTDTVEIWNSFFVTKTLDSISETGTTGLTLIRPVTGPTEPTDYLQIQSQVYTVSASPDGPASILATYDWNFNGVSYENLLTVTGDRLIPWPYLYETNFSERLVFLTDIISAFNGSEQRISARKLARQEFSLRYLIYNENDRQRALNAVFGHHGRFFGVPLFHWGRPLLADVSAGASQLLVNFVNMDFRESTSEQRNMLMIWRSPTDFEVAQITAGGLATPGQIDLEEPLIGAHTADSIVAPVQFCLSKDPSKYGEFSTNVLDFRTSWLSRDFADLSDLSSLPALDSIPVLEDPNLMTGPQLPQGFRIEYDIYDGGTGIFDSIVNRTVPETQTMLGFEFNTEAGAYTLRKILYGLKGKQKSFWMPTHRNDFTITQAIGSADTTIIFTENDFHKHAEGGPDPWGGIRIELFDGTVYHKQITGSTAPSAGEESIDIDSGLGDDVAVADIFRASLLLRSRLNTDKVTIQHRRTGAISVTVPVVGVKESA